MKKVLAILAIAAIFSACNGGTDSAAAAVDTVVSNMETAVDSTMSNVAATVDSTAAAIADSAKANAAGAVEAVKDAVKEEVKK